MEFDTDGEMAYVGGFDAEFWVLIWTRGGQVSPNL